MSNKAIFLDRDGTIIFDYGYNHKPEQLKILPGAPEGLKQLEELGFKLVVITNQSGIARGYFSLQAYHDFNSLFMEEMRKQGVVFDGVYFCPHIVSDGCNCRKPGTALPLRAKKDLGIDFAISYFIGDKDEDALCGQRIGCKTVRIRSEYKQTLKSDYLVDNLAEFAGLLKEQNEPGRQD